LKKPILQPVNFCDWKNSGISVTVLREDLVHAFFSGNKYRKLKYNLINFRNSGKKIILTFGGAFSNHLVATAAAVRENEFACIGIIRGEDISNSYIEFMKSCGMKLHFISRSDYRNKMEESFFKKLTGQLIERKFIQTAEELFVIPEGGTNAAAVKGASEIMDDIPIDTDYIACACGTGGTLAGISLKLLPHQNAIGVSVLKADGYFQNEINRLGGNPANLLFSYDYHFGGYAKAEKKLLDFCERFTKETSIPIEPVYTGKLFFAIDDLIRKNYFKKGSKVTLIHTGGIFNFEQ
jgi:1-aminocyclopropane-1-carboxylate deaminase